VTVRCWFSTLIVTSASENLLVDKTLANSIFQLALRQPGGANLADVSNVDEAIRANGDGRWKGGRVFWRNSADPHIRAESPTGNCVSTSGFAGRATAVSLRGEMVRAGVRTSESAAAVATVPGLVTVTAGTGAELATAGVFLPKKLDWAGTGAASAVTKAKRSRIRESMGG